MDLQRHETLLLEPSLGKLPKVVWGLTGGIGSGKSTVAKLFENRDIPVVDTDILALLARKTRKDQIQECFGTTEPAKLREIIYSDERHKAQLESIVFPEVQKSLLAILERFDSPVLVECALFSKGFVLYPIEPYQIIGVVADRETRIQRVMKRNGFTREEVIKIMEVQASDEDIKRVSSAVIHNNKAQDDEDMVHLVNTMVGLLQASHKALNLSVA